MAFQKIVWEDKLPKKSVVWKRTREDASGFGFSYDKENGWHDMGFSSVFCRYAHNYLESAIYAESYAEGKLEPVSLTGSTSFSGSADAEGWNGEFEVQEVSAGDPEDIRLDSQ